MIFLGGGSAGAGSFQITIGPLHRSASGAVELQIATSPSQSAEDVAANVAAAINANASLQAQGIFAVVTGHRIDIGGGGMIHGASATDPNLSFELNAPQVQEHPHEAPLLGPAAVSLLAPLLAAVGVWVRRSRPAR